MLGEQIDSALQSMNDGQTVGIPIGPDCSLVVAELILCAVDAELTRLFPSSLKGFRHIDDYELTFPNLREAEDVLSALEAILGDYALRLNPRKTRIEELPIGFEDRWAVELSKYPIRSNANPVSQRNDVLGLFSQALEVAASHPEEPVLHYAIARVRNENIHPDGWRAFQNCVTGASNIEPSALASALGTLHSVSVLGGLQISKAALTELIETIVETHAPRNHGSEVAWALWGALAWKIPLSISVANRISAMEDDVVALLAMDCEVNGLFGSNLLNKGRWALQLLDPDIAKSEHWLLAYEAAAKQWLPCPGISTDAEFGPMLQAGVTFYDPLQNTPQIPPAAQPIPGGAFPSAYG